jgi:uncharacterized protein CbrC (UPF0167 family)
MTLRGESSATDGVRFVCDACLVGGKLVERGTWVNLANGALLRAELTKRHPEWSDNDIERLARERTVEVEQRTPAPLTWQDFFWPAHCGDYCRYEREVGKPDLAALASDRDIPDFIEECLQEDDRAMTNARELWEDLRPESPEGIKPAYSIGVYLFQCLACDRFILLWDCD